MKDMKSKVINGLIKGCINVGEKLANTFSFAAFFYEPKVPMELLKRKDN